MPVKVTVKGKKEPEKPAPQSSQPLATIFPPVKKKGDFYILVRIKKMINIMKMDIRMKFNKKLKKEYEDYARFAELARKGQ
ncbi:MAG: hypothetical protein M0Q91_05490 [Methanoregula sp.]|jgi:hypothetical protein|nr:hypothetical protein [Methanoregula sp.]